MIVAGVPEHGGGDSGAVAPFPSERGQESPFHQIVILKTLDQLLPSKYYDTFEYGEVYLTVFT